MEKLFCVYWKEQQKIKIRKAKYKEYYQTKKNDILLKKQEYYQQNRESIIENVKIYNKGYSKGYYQENRESILLYSKAYKEKNSEELKIKNSIYYHNNKEVIKSLVNKEERRIYQRNYIKKRRIMDNSFRIRINLRSMIYRSLKIRGYKKGSKTEHILGLSFDKFQTYIQLKFESWMTWDNYGKYNGELNYGWDIDHIIPLSSVKTKEELLLLNHYSNLQPLCSKVNRDIKRNII